MSRKRAKAVPETSQYESQQHTRQPQKKKTWSIHDLKHIKPMTENQKFMFEEYMSGQHICAHGHAGTGKSFVAMYLALNDLLSPHTETTNIIIIRSVVPTREVGHLPGTLAEKAAPYEMPYADMFQALLGRSSSYQDMKDANIVEFATTSFIRGLTWDNTVVIVDECQNMQWAELDSVITRIGVNSRLVLCGDGEHQLDLKRGERSGFNDALNIISRLPEFTTVKFEEDDIVRSDFVKRWIIARTAAGL